MILILYSIQTARRNILKNRLHALINIAGLSVAMTASIMILMFVWDDQRFDRFHENAERIFRVIREVPDWGMSVALNPLPMANALKTDLPEVEAAASFTRFIRSFIRHGNQWSKEGPICFTDPSFFQMFSLEFIRGSPDEAFAEPGSIVMTQKLAHEIFGQEDPVGQSLFVHSIGEVRVQGIIEDPKRSHISLGLILPMSLYPRPGYVDNWNNSNFTTYIMLRKGVTHAEFQREHSSYLDKIFGSEANQKLYFQPLQDVYLKSNFAYDFMCAPYSLSLHYLLVLVAFSILAIACFNYINIETARGARRTSEVAVRKTFGATGFHMMIQFLGEAVFLSVLAFVLAIALVDVLLPPFNRWTEIKDLNLYDTVYWNLLIGMAMAAVATGLAAGSYPAYLLASLKPTEALGQMHHGIPMRPLVRKTLVAFQYFVSIVLIVSALTILAQRDFLTYRNPGYSPENIVVTDLPDRVQDKYDAFKALLRQDPVISGVTAARDLPTWEGPSTLLTDWDGKAESGDFLIHYAVVDPDFIETMGIRLVAGISFAMDTSGKGLIVNQEAVKQMRLAEPIGTRISGWQHEGRIIGVVQDYNYNNLREKVDPLILKVDRKQFRVAYIRVSGDNIDESIKVIKKAWQQIEPDYPFNHLLLSDNLKKMYKLEEKVGELFLAASGFALLLSCIGLYGLTSFVCEQRTKEIAIRKAYGATSLNILHLILFDFLKLVVIANLMAWLVAYVCLNQWLQGFAYHIELKFLPFSLAAIVSLLAVVLAVGIKTLKSAAANPTEALRYE